MTKHFILFLCVILSTKSNAQQKQQWDPFLDTVQQRTIQWFLDVTPKETGLTPDRYPTLSFSSVAAIGFSLTSYGVAVERNYIARADAINRTLTTLRFLWKGKQGDAPQGMIGYRGFFYHFLNDDGTRFENVELSTIDTALLFAGILFAQSYFDRDSPQEKEIRLLADSLYRRIDWQWAMAGSDWVSMGWKPDGGFLDAFWRGYNEAMILYILALASPTHPVPETVWDAWTASYIWEKYYGQEHLNFMPLLGHQYSHVWIDFRGIKDSYMQKKGIDYFENSRRATYVHYEYSKLNPNKWRDYSDSIWGMTACDGPKDTIFEVDGIKRDFRSYSARGTGADEHLDDGTITPTAAGGSIPFAPEITIPALKAMKNKYGDKLWTKYGFLDAFNPTYITPKTPNGWFDHDYIGIDQGPIALMIENYRNGFVWEVMKKNPYIVKGLKKAGFTGGWVDAVKEAK
ncbi:MAG: glucoamylase family protein [Bacteriovoracaceae bacterium]|nr:Tat pathway signal protein [Bacteroidota bacterium]